jgi:hypothetical protein
MGPVNCHYHEPELRHWRLFFFGGFCKSGLKKIQIRQIRYRASLLRCDSDSELSSVGKTLFSICIAMELVGIHTSALFAMREMVLCLRVYEFCKI